MLQFMKGFNVKLCYYYEYGVKEDIEFIRNLFPQTENIAIISDNSYAGLSQMKYVENEIAEHFPDLQIIHIYNPQIQISAESETKRSIFREKDKTKRSKKESAQHSKSRNKSFVMTSVSAL